MAEPLHFKSNDEYRNWCEHYRTALTLGTSDDKGLLALHNDAIKVADDYIIALRERASKL